MNFLLETCSLKTSKITMLNQCFIDIDKATYTYKIKRPTNYAEISIY